jgi:transcriptional regulator with XRE-family HTH domain
MGSMLRRLREVNGLTQVELAKKVGVTQSYIAQLESGRKISPSLEMLKKLAKALDVPVATLME